MPPDEILEEEFVFEERLDSVRNSNWDDTEPNRRTDAILLLAEVLHYGLKAIAVTLEELLDRQAQKD